MPPHQCFQVVTKAIKEDGKGNYVQALAYYKTALGHFDNAAKRKPTFKAFFHQN